MTSGPDLVLTKVLPLDKGPVAGGAAKGSFPGVQTKVVPQVARVDEPLLAVVAGVGPTRIMLLLLLLGVGGSEVEKTSGSGGRKIEVFSSPISSGE